MIIVNLNGGLGNQMFQYTCGRALSLRSGDTELKLDISGLERANEVGDIYRPYGLSNFNIQAGIAETKEVKKLKERYGIISKGWRFFRMKILRQNYVAFVPRIFRSRGNIYLDGYFQSEKYFEDFAEYIRTDLIPKTLSVIATDWKQNIASETNAVSVHFRRGDYVGHNTLGEICSGEYYQRAIGIVAQQAPGSRFFIFSDDIDWVRDNIKFPDGSKVDYVSSPDLKDYEELILMATCRHNIIANSSFSWWGAWLNPNPNKIVIAPRKWAHGMYNNLIKLRNIIPAKWTKI